MDAPTHRRLAIAGQELRPLGRLGEGTYACVILAGLSESRSDAQGPTLHQSGGGLIAVKIWKSKSNEVVRLAKREVVVHTRLNGHPNIVHLRGAYRSGGGRPILLMDYCPRDLQSELRLHPAGLPGATVKLLAWQLVQAIRFIHAEKLLHRDLKPTNLLLTADGILKVGDFGLAREAPTREPRTGCPGEEALTQYVVTRWYRAPEVLLNKPYGTAADMWSVGCTIAEMAIGTPLLPGHTSVDQIFLVWRMFGGLPQRSAGAGTAAKNAAAPHPPPRTPMHRSSLRARLGTLVEEPLLELLEAALRTDPHERATAEDLLRMPYFDEIPELVAGTALESLYDWSTGAATARAISLQAAELDLPISRPTQAEVAADPLLSPPSAAPPTAADWQADAAAAAGAAAAGRRADDAAQAARPAAVGSPVTRLRTEAGTLTVPESAAAAAAAAIGLLDGVDAGEQQRGGGDGCGSVGQQDDQDFAWGFRGGEGRELGELVGPVGPALLQRCQRADPRVGGSKAAKGAMPRVSSLPVLDEGEPENQRDELCRTTSMGPAARRQPAGGGGGGDGGGGGSGRQLRARTGGRAGAAMSVRNIFAQGHAPSNLSSWCGSQWELATAAGEDAAPTQEAATGHVTQGQLWGTTSITTTTITTITTITTTTIPEDEPLVESLQQQQPQQQQRPQQTTSTQLEDPLPHIAELSLKGRLSSVSPKTAATATVVAATAAAAAVAASSSVGTLGGRHQEKLSSKPSTAAADAFLFRCGTALSDRGPTLLDVVGGGGSTAKAAAVLRASDVRPCPDVLAAADFVPCGIGLRTPLAPQVLEGGACVGGDGGGGGGGDAVPSRARSPQVNTTPNVLLSDAGLSVQDGQERALALKLGEAGGQACAAAVGGGMSQWKPPPPPPPPSAAELSSTPPARRGCGRGPGDSETAGAVDCASGPSSPPTAAASCTPSECDDGTAKYDVPTGNGPLEAVCDTCNSDCAAGVVPYRVPAAEGREKAAACGDWGTTGQERQRAGGGEEQRARERGCGLAGEDGSYQGLPRPSNEGLKAPSCFIPCAAAYDARKAGDACKGACRGKCSSEGAGQQGGEGGSFPRRILRGVGRLVSCLA